MYTLKQACQILNLTEHTIRYYTDIGIVEVKRDKNNHRLFDEQALDWLKGTKYLRELGMSIQDIKLFHELCKKEGDQAIQERLDILIKQKEKVNRKVRANLDKEKAEEELEAAKQRLQFLNHKIEKEKRILNHLIDDNQNPSKKYILKINTYFTYEQLRSIVNKKLFLYISSCCTFSYHSK